jgi:hypothetical protein
MLALEKGFSSSKVDISSPQTKTGRADQQQLTETAYSSTRTPKARHHAFPGTERQSEFTEQRPT